MTARDINEIWDGLSEEDKDLFIEHKDKKLSPQAIDRATKVGFYVAGAYWTATQSGPDELRWSQEVQKLVEQKAKERES